MSMIPRVRFVLVAALLGCDQSSRDAPPAPPPGSSAAPRSLPSSGPVVREVTPLPVSGSASPPAAPAEIEGAWEGHYDAKKATVTLPSKVKDKGIAADDGKAAAGRGPIDLVILAGGDVRGKVSGALGAGGISGKVDGAMIRATVQPDDPLAPNAMAGIFLGQRKGETIVGELHVAGPDATVIREAIVELIRKR